MSSIMESALPLFDAFPAVARTIHRAGLAELPTPLEVHDGGVLGLRVGRLMVKRDDLSGRAYGGNKVRKLEFLLGEAVHRGAAGVLTFGVAGSNHALATSIYARARGLTSYSMLTRQSNAAYVRRNLLAGFHAGARLMAFDSEEAAAAGARQLIDAARARGELIVGIPGGGSSPVGCLGFVNAGLELAGQIRALGLPEPDRVYLALGTVGTAAGLLLGMRLAGLATRMVAVRVVREDVARPGRLTALIRDTGKLLGFADAPVDELPEVRHEFIGPGYARFTPEGVAALGLAHRHLGLKLEGTYTGKAFAALLEDARAGRLEGETILFWDTYNSRPLNPEALSGDYRELPEPFHFYFEEPLQPLDPEASPPTA
jgi:1-aminocyclopropane-1-carboxylate deaminase/D-cysteine desulfhydrase-like pyridoxal-dependent ACC family enzyme